MAENRVWHACCIMNGMTGKTPAQTFRRATMNIKSSLFAAVAALFVSSLAVGSAVAPAAVVAFAPVSADFYA